MTGRTVRFDPHVHTDASHDATGSVEEVLDRCEEAALDAVAITDHDTAVAARRALEVADRYDVVVVPGVEISTAAGHLLALGVEREPPAGRPFAATVEWVRERGGLAIVPHPFQRTRHGVPERAIRDCDGIETRNAWAVTGVRNRRAAAFARREGYPALGASDAHWPATVATAHTAVSVEGVATADRVLGAIADGRCRPAGRTASNGAYLRKTAENVRRTTRVSRRRFGALADRLRTRPTGSTGRDR